MKIEFCFSLCLMVMTVVHILLLPVNSLSQTETVIFILSGAPDTIKSLNLSICRTAAVNLSPWSYLLPALSGSPVLEVSDSVAYSSNYRYIHLVFYLEIKINSYMPKQVYPKIHHLKRFFCFGNYKVSENILNKTADSLQNL